MSIAFPALLKCTAVTMGCLAVVAPATAGEDSPFCGGLPTYAQLKAALTRARQTSNGGFNLDMWGTVVHRDGVACAVA